MKTILILLTFLFLSFSCTQRSDLSNNGGKSASSSSFFPSTQTTSGSGGGGGNENGNLNLPQSTITTNIIDGEESTNLYEVHDDTSSTMIDEKNYEVAVDTDVSEDLLKNIQFVINNVNVKISVNAVIGFDNQHIMFAGSSYNLKQPFFLKADLKGNIDNTFNNNLGYATIAIPNYNFKNIFGKLIQIPQTKDFVYFGLSQKWNDNSKSFYTVVAIKQDGSPSNIFNGKPYLVDETYNIADANIQDIYLENENTFTSVFWNQGGPIFCTHNLFAYSCQQKNNQFSSNIVKQVKLIDYKNSKYIYAGTAGNTISKLWSVDKSNITEHMNSSEGKLNAFIQEKNGDIYAVGGAPHTKWYRPVVWKLNSDLSLDLNFSPDGRRFYNVENSGFLEKIYNIKNNHVLVGTEGEKLDWADSYAIHAVISTIDFASNERKIIFKKFDNTLIKAIEQIGDDIYVIAVDGLGITKFVKTKLVEVD